MTRLSRALEIAQSLDARLNAAVANMIDASPLRPLDIQYSKKEDGMVVRHVGTSDKEKAEALVARVQKDRDAAWDAVNWERRALFPITRLRPLVGQAIKVDNLVFQIVCEEEMVLLKYGKIWKGDGTFVSYDNDVLYAAGHGWGHAPRGCEEKAMAIQALRSYADQGD